LWQSYKPLVTIYIIVPPFVNSSLLENSYFAVLYPFTSYVKLQQAYFSESNVYGGWTLIGYTAPGADGKTNNFTFTSGATLTAENTTSGAVADAWEAANNVKLNDCEPGKNWVVELTAVADGQDAYTANVAGGADCKALTATFENIGK
jgi:hypothetical protein